MRAAAQPLIRTTLGALRGLGTSVRRLGVGAIVVVGLLTLSQTLANAFSMVSFYMTYLTEDISRRLIFGFSLAASAFALSLLFGVGLIVWRERLADWWFHDDGEVAIDIDALTD